MKDAQVFTPRALAQAPIVSEGRLVRDLTMKEPDYATLEIPTYQRRTAKAVRLPSFLRKQAT